MLRSVSSYLWDIANAIEHIDEFVNGLDEDAFKSNILVQSAVERQFEIIGEAMKQAEKYFPGSMTSLPKFKAAIAFRDRLAHGYFNIDPDVPWRAIFEELPALKEAVTKILPPAPEVE